MTAKLRVVADEDAETEQKRMEEIEAFNEVWADYLEALAKASRSSKLTGSKCDKEMDRLMDALNATRDRLMSVPAVNGYQYRHKFDVLRDILEDWCGDRGALMVVNSIESDILQATE